MSKLCPYRDVLGKPNEGFHKHFLGIAINDVIGTILIGILIWFILDKTSHHVDLWKIEVFLFLLAIVLHRMFCVNTTINKLIFGTV
jgi:hypothetical protein